MSTSRIQPAAGIHFRRIPDSVPPGCHRLVVPLVAGMLLVAVGCESRQASRRAGSTGDAGAGRTQEDVRTLEPGRAAVERDMGSATVHVYRIPLRAQDYLQLVVEQLGVDLVLTIVDPDHEEVLTVDSPTGVRGPEAAFLVAGMAGDYLVEVRPWRASASGRYRIRIEESGPASDGQRARAKAARVFAESQRLSQEGGPESLQRAVKLLEEAGALWHRQGVLEQETLTLRSLADTWSRLGESRLALDLYERALRLSDVLGRRSQDASLLNSVGSAHLRVGDAESAFAFFEEALRVAETTGDRHEEIAALNNLAVRWQSAGEPWRALERYDQALAGWKELADPRGEAVTLYNLGSIYTLLNRTLEARDALLRASELYRTIGDSRGEASTRLALGWADLRAGQPQTALESFTAALALHRAAEDRRGTASALAQVGTAHLEAGRLDQAETCYREALEIARELGDRLREGQVLNDLGQLDELRGEPGSAAARHRSALGILRDLRERTGEAYSLFRLAQAERSLGHLAAARSHVEQALARVEATRDASRSDLLGASYLASAYDVRELQIDLLMRLHAEAPREGFDRLALEAVEQSRARSLLAILAEERHGAGMTGSDGALSRRLGELRQAINAKERERMAVSGSRDPTPQARQELELEMRDLLVEHEKTRTALRQRSATSLARSTVQPLGVEEIQQQVLDEATLLLVFALGEDRSFLYLVGRHTFSAHELPSRDQIEAAALHLYELLSHRVSRRSAAPAELAAAALGELLLGPVAAQLGEKRLLIVGDGAARLVPFCALLAPPSGVADPSTAKEPLVIDHEIVYLPSASVLPLLRSRLSDRPPAPKTLAVLADPVFDSADPRLGGAHGDAGDERAPGTAWQATADLERSAREFGADGFERLPAARIEAESILALAAPEKRLAALGLDAHRDLVTGGQLADYRMIHFATHGLANARYPELSGVVLSLVDRDGNARDGYLRAHEIQGLHLAADLVVLSACKTAVGPRLRGEGFLGLGRSFLLAGAAGVVVSLWNVSDQGTAELMERFYRGMLRDGLHPAAALRAAQVAMIRDPRWAAAYHWAGFLFEGA